MNHYCEYPIKGCSCDSGVREPDCNEVLCDEPASIKIYQKWYCEKHGEGAAIRASCGVGPLRDFYGALLAKGMKPEMARLTLARKIAAIALTVWKKEERFDAEQLKASGHRVRQGYGSQLLIST